MVVIKEFFKVKTNPDEFNEVDILVYELAVGDVLANSPDAVDYLGFYQALCLGENLEEKGFGEYNVCAMFDDYGHDNDVICELIQTCAETIYLTVNRVVSMMQRGLDASGLSHIDAVKVFLQGNPDVNVCK